MPNHCYSSETAPSPQAIDYEVIWNWQVSRSTTLVTVAKDTTLYDTLTCDAAAYTNDHPVLLAEEKADFAPLSESYNMDEAVGIALNGVLFYPGSTPEKYDPIYPKGKSSKDKPKRVTLDACLGTTDGTETGVYHYHTMSPCILNSPA